MTASHLLLYRDSWTAGKMHFPLDYPYRLARYLQAAQIEPRPPECGDSSEAPTRGVSLPLTLFALRLGRCSRLREARYCQR